MVLWTVKGNHIKNRNILIIELLSNLVIRTQLSKIWLVGDISFKRWKKKET